MKDNERPKKKQKGAENDEWGKKSALNALNIEKNRLNIVETTLVPPRQAAPPEAQKIYSCF